MPAEGHRYASVRSIAPLLVGFAALLVVANEGLRIWSLYSRVERAAYWALRYAVTREYDPRYCPEPCAQGTEAHRHALLESIRDAAAAGFMDANYTASAWSLDASSLSLTICSDTENTTYVEQTHECVPTMHPSEPGGTVSIRASYPYTLGSSLGLNLWRIRLEAKEEGQVECYKLGCDSYLRINLIGDIPDHFTIEAMSIDGYLRLIECDDGRTIRSEGFLLERHAECHPDGATLVGFDPSIVDVLVTWSDGSLREHLRPNYLAARPNGYRCLPICLWGTVEIDVE